MVTETQTTNIDEIQEASAEARYERDLASYEALWQRAKETLDDLVLAEKASCAAELIFCGMEFTMNLLTFGVHAGIASEEDLEKFRERKGEYALRVMEGGLMEVEIARAEKAQSTEKEGANAQ